MMPALTWKRDNQDMPLSVRTIREYLSLNNVIKLQRDDAIPAVVRDGLKGYLDTLPGFVLAVEHGADAVELDPSAPVYNLRSHGYGTTAEPGEPAHSGYTAAETLWWKFTAT